MTESISGGASQVAPKGIRFAAAFCDIIVIPVALGVAVGLFLLIFPPVLREIFLAVLNGGWLTFRDAVYSPGRHFSVRRIIHMISIPLFLVLIVLVLLSGRPESIIITVLFVVLTITAVFLVITDKGGDLKLISLTGSKVTPIQAFIRNILLMIPIVLVFGYLVEIIMIILKGDRLADRWSKTKVIPAG